MVSQAVVAGMWGPLLAEKLLLDRLDPDTRARVLAALAGLILLGFCLVALVWLGGRITRRYIRRADVKRKRASEISRDDWARLPQAGEAAKQSRPPGEDPAGENPEANS